MFCVGKQLFIALLWFSGSLGKKCLSLNNKPCITRLTLIDLNDIEIKYSLMIIGHKYYTSCNSLDYSSEKVCVPNKTKDVNLKYIIWQ